MSARILVVDDNPTNLKLISDLLEFEGHQIFQAVDAQTAEEIIDREFLDLVLLDIALPGMDGLTFTRKLRANEKTRDLIIIALTAFAMVGDEQKARDAGCNGYITKPIDTRTLPRLVAGYLPTPSPDIPRMGMKILIVEDTPSELKLAQLVLSAAGHDVSGAEAAEQALQEVKLNRPQIILLDLLLPGAHGLPFARKLKADPETRGIHVVAITSYPERFPKAEALAAGCDAYLVKPLNTRELSGRLEEIIHRPPRSAS